MSLHAPTALAPGRRRLGLIAAFAATCATVGAATSVVADARPAPIHTVTESSQPLTSGYFDIEANKAASMRALGRRMAGRPINRSSRYQDIEANKARRNVTKPASGVVESGLSPRSARSGGSRT